MPPEISRCEYLPDELLGVGAGSGCGAPLASPSIVIVGHADRRALGELRSSSS